MNPQLLLENLRGGARLLPSSRFFYRDGDHALEYDPTRLESVEGVISLMHEDGHSVLGHTGMALNARVLEQEQEAWEYARSRAQELALQVDEAYIDSCLTTYESYIQERQQCPECGAIGREYAPDIYTCPGCYTDW